MLGRHLTQQPALSLKLCATPPGEQRRACRPQLAPRRDVCLDTPPAVHEQEQWAHAVSAKACAKAAPHAFIALVTTCLLQLAQQELAACSSLPGKHCPRSHSPLLGQTPPVLQCQVGVPLLCGLRCSKRCPGCVHVNSLAAALSATTRGCECIVQALGPWSAHTSKDDRLL